MRRLSNNRNVSTSEKGNNMDQQKRVISPGEQARNNLILTLHFNHKLTDDFLPPEQFQIMLTQPFSQWPKELQDKLAHFGAAMIQ